MVRDYLSRLTPKIFEPYSLISNCFPDETLISIETLPCYANLVNFLVTEKISPHLKAQDIKTLNLEVKSFFYNDSHLF